jgi:hypothetical protein
MKFFKKVTYYPTKDQALDNQWYQNFDLNRTASVIWAFTIVRKQKPSGDYAVISYGFKH